MSAPELNNAELLELIYNNEWMTPRERQVFLLKYREGLLNYQIAQRMNMSKETVGRDLKKIYRKIEPLIIKYYNALL